MIKKPPLVSIILPTYNRAEWLPKSIGSVLSQTYLNWELIIWDDGSNDNTEETVLSFQDHRINYYFKENRGMSYALNQAIKVSQGDHIAFIDDDDQWLSEKLARQIQIMEGNPDIDILFGDFYNLNLSTKEEGRGFEQCKNALRQLEVKEFQSGVFKIQQGILKGILISNFIAFDTVVVRKDIFGIAGYFNENLRNAQDLEFWWRMALAGLRFAYIDAVVMKRIKPPESLSSPSIASYQNRINCLDYCLLQALLNNREDLIPFLNSSYQKNWQGVIRQHASLGNRQGAIDSFFKSIKYGISLEACYELFRAFGGSKLANEILKKIKFFYMIMLKNED